MERRFYIGGYAEGIGEVAADPSGGTLRHLRTLEGVHNPTWLLTHPNGRILYAVEEQAPEGNVVALRLDGGTPTVAARLRSGGADPCHLTLDETGRYLAVSNYTSGSLTVFALDGNGIPTVMTENVQRPRPQRPGNLRRQSDSHVHYAQWHHGILYVCDLGWDLVLRYRLNPQTGRLTDLGNPIELPAGSGPRHLCFPPVDNGCCYVLTEMTCAVYCCRRQGAGWTVTEEAVLLPPDWPGDPSGHEGYGAAIRCAADGRHLLVSCRVLNVLHAFFIGDDGGLRHCGQAFSGGETPRDFAILEDRWVLAANQDSGTLRVLRWDDANGSMTPTDGTLPFSGAACIAPAF